VEVLPKLAVLVEGISETEHIEPELALLSIFMDLPFENRLVGLSELSQCSLIETFIELTAFGFAYLFIFCDRVILLFKLETF